VTAPPPFRITEEPEQIVGLLTLAVTGGKGWIDTEMAAVVEPQALLPTTEYVLETVVVKGTLLVMFPVQL
jgi:hypothetical protein